MNPLRATKIQNLAQSRQNAAASHDHVITKNDLPTFHAKRNRCLADPGHGPRLGQIVTIQRDIYGPDIGDVQPLGKPRRQNISASTDANERDFVWLLAARANVGRELVQQSLDLCGVGNGSHIPSVPSSARGPNLAPMPAEPTHPHHDPLEPGRKRLATDTDDGLLVIISGPSGAGKTTITRAVERAIPGSVFSVSWTTRPRRPVDVEGVDYHFVDDAAFDAMIAENGFIEWVNLFGKKYGTPKAWAQEQIARGRLVILEIDVVGAIKVKAQIPEAFGLFIMPPNEHTLLDRLRARRREGEDEIQRRFAEAKREMEQAQTCGVYQRFIINDKLDHSIPEAISAVLSHREALRFRRSQE